MTTQTAHEFGIFTTDPERLRQRYRVSRGITILNPSLARQGGYRPVPAGAPGIIVPRLDRQYPLSSLHEPTDEELAAITATPDTHRTIQIVRMHADIASRLLAQCVTARIEGSRGDEGDPRRELIPGIVGFVRGDRIDAPGQLSTTMSSKFPDHRVGDHIDAWTDVDTSFLVANMGPGDRWHRVTPDINRVAVKGTGIAEQAAFVAAHPDPGTIPVHWFKLAAPVDGYVEAALNLPVAWATHDGSTIGSHLPSQAALGVMDAIKPSTLYPSVV